MNFRFLKDKAQAGFTLIEVLIAMFLLTVISIAIYQATTETYRLREVLQNEGDFYNNIRLAMSLMDRDVTLMFSPVPVVPGPVSKPTRQGNPELMEQMRIAGLDRESEFWNPAIHASGIRPSRFVGKEQSMSFISSSHVRLYRESPESEFAKITYGLRDDVPALSGFAEEIPDSRTLVKTEDPNAFDLEEDRTIEVGDRKYRRTYPLLNGIRKLKFEYYRKRDDRWFVDWDTNSRDFYGEYPDMIRMTVEVAGPSRLFFEGNYLFKPEMPFYGLHPSY